MSTYTWTDPWIEQLSFKEKLVYIYLCFNQSDNLAGIYQLSKSTVSGQTGLNMEDINAAFLKFETDGKIMFKDNIIAIKNRIKNNNTENKFIRKSITNILKNSPSWAVEFVNKEGLVDETSRRPKGEVDHLNKDKDKDKDKNTSTKDLKSFNALGYFCDIYLLNMKKKYIPNGGKDGKQLKTLLTQITEDEYKQLLPRFFQSQDEFIKGSDYGVGVFKSQVNKLRQERPQTIQKTQYPGITQTDKSKFEEYAGWLKGFNGMDISKMDVKQFIAIYYSESNNTMRIEKLKAFL